MKDIYRFFLLLTSLQLSLQPLSAQNGGGNYVKTETYTGSSSTVTDIQYYDGLGRPSVAASNATTKSRSSYAYTFQDYDAMGRPSKVWLPGIGGTPTVPPKPSDVESWSRSSNGGDSYAYAQTAYDALDRPVAVQGPGRNWQGKKEQVR